MVSDLPEVITTMTRPVPVSNPFDSLYVTETIDPESFVDVFSPLLVQDTISLFRPGNVILIGSQGSGKSMLLTLLKPETRIAFSVANRPFPLTEDASRFIGIGVNLVRSGAIDFGQRPLSDNGVDSPELVESFFGDFLNAWLVRDLIRSLTLLASVDQVSEELQIARDRDVLDRFAEAFARHECWSGAFRSVRSIEALSIRLTERVRLYRDFLNFNVDTIPSEVSKAKSSAGEPVSVAAELLREIGVIPGDVEIFVRVDQYEELSRLEEWQPAGERSTGYSAVIHKMLGLRDPRVSYRIGTRRHSWPAQPRMQGTTAVLEELRNFKIVDLDDVLQGREHRKGPFPQFAEDVFRRRVTWARYSCPKATSCIGQVFGRSLSAKDKAARYVSRSDYRVSLPDEASPATIEAVRELAQEDPLEARLAEAWVTQRLAREEEYEFVLSGPGDYPWDPPHQKWWRKERIAQALLQIAARQQQRMIWYGKEDVLALAGGNILVFVSICQAVWDAWLRADGPIRDGRGDVPLPRIENTYVQDEGILQASRYWHRKIRSDPDGDRRQRFVNTIGQLFREWLRDDRAMSYPGHNGFSIDDEEFSSDPGVKTILEEAAAYGVLMDRTHSTRNRGEGLRRKWYLHPIYSPHFQIPVSHVKEPRYVRVADVREWLVAADVLPKGARAPHGASPTPQQESLFEG